MIRTSLAAFVVAGLASGTHAGFVEIPDLFPTGVDDSGMVLPGGATDPHYFILETGGFGIVVSKPHDTWARNDTNSKWIWETATGQPTNVTRTFRLTFDLTGLDPSTATITGEWATDNTGLDILINGMSTGNTSGGFSSFTRFFIGVDAGFVDGINTLDFVVLDFGSISGFRVGEISGMALPAPATFLLLGLGGLRGTRRRRRP